MYPTDPSKPPGPHNINAADPEGLKQELGVRIKAMAAACAYLDHCTEKAASWCSALGEDNYLRSLETVELDRRDTIKRKQRSRRISYFGWQLAVSAAFVSAKSAVSQYDYFVSSVVFQADRNLLDQSSMTNFLRRMDDGTENLPASYYMMAASKFDVMIEDATNGHALEGLQQAYDECLKSVPYPTLKGAFFNGGVEPMTFVSWSFCQEPLVGAHLLPEYRRLLNKHARAGADGKPVTRMQALDGVYERLNRPQTDARLRQLSGVNTTENMVQAQHIQLQGEFYTARLSWQIDEMQQYLTELRDFRSQLVTFVELHRGRPLGKVQDNENPALLAARYNVLSAWAMLPAVDALISEWDGRFKERYLPMVQNPFFHLKGSDTDLSHRVGHHFTMLTHGIRASTEAPARFGTALLIEQLELERATFEGKDDPNRRIGMIEASLSSFKPYKG